MCQTHGMNGQHNSLDIVKNPQLERDLVHPQKQVW